MISYHIAPQQNVVRRVLTSYLNTGIGITPALSFLKFLKLKKGMLNKLIRKLFFTCY